MDVLVSEVGPRDGLQSIKRSMPTAVKHQWIRALAESGLAEIEVASFVPAKLLPQMADAAEVVREAVKIPGLTVLALAPNLRGVQDAIAAGAHKVTLPVSASHAHSLSNIRMTCEEAVAQVGRICKFRDGLPQERQPKIEVGIATAFGCTLQGAVPEDDVVRLAVALAEAGVDDVGVRTFDSSLGGLGGCPYAPGASGNVVTEDLVFMFEAMGVSTGVDLAKLLAARAPLQQGLPGEPLYGMTPEAGLPKGFVQELRHG